ncbi:MBL fold metallo-hydrolase [Cohnella suwonensis]|uniref:MBL fold metallo-hydrolase n=1 Tax=Cohnella suwonensis TaxID=696072 RepID=A0ABW0M3Q3_9BACL
MLKHSWGKTTQLQFLPKLFPINCYLVEEDDGLTLIDAGMPFAAKGIEEAIRATGKPLVRMLLTHAHDDHIGAVPYLKERHPEARVGISRRDESLLRGDLSLLPGEAQTPIKGSVPKKTPFQADFLFGDGDVIGSLRAIATPGHTPGHFAFYEPEGRVLIGGDAFQSKGGFAVSGTIKWKFPFPALATWHAATAIESAVRVRELDPAVLLVGHGPAVEQPADAIDRAVRKAEKSLKERKTG